MKIIKATENQYDAVRFFYYSLIDEIKGSQYYIGWKKDIYPSSEFLCKSIVEGELYIGVENDEIVAAMVLNHQYNEGYINIHWQTEAKGKEITIIHALGVRPIYSGKGYAVSMVKKAFEIAADSNQKAIRLDVLSGNLPAKKLYTKMGFRYIDTSQMYYEDTGRTEFELYEYVLN